MAKKKHPSPWITQALRRAALCKQRTHFPPRYDGDAEWRPPLSDFPPSSGPPPSSYLTPPSHTGTQWKGIPHYLSSCLAWSISSLSDIRSHLNLDTNVRHCIFRPEWNQNRANLKRNPTSMMNLRRVTMKWLADGTLPTAARSKNNLKQSLWVIREAALHKNPPMGRHTTQSTYLLRLEVSSQSKSSIDLQHRAAGETRSCAGGPFSRRRSTPASRRRTVPAGAECEPCLPLSLFQVILFSPCSGSLRSPSSRLVPTSSSSSSSFQICLCWIDTETLLWSPHPFLNEAQAPQRKGKHCLLACSLSSFCSYTIMHIVCTAPPPPHSLCLQPSLSCGFSLTRSLSLWHTHTPCSFSISV